MKVLQSSLLRAVVAIIVGVLLVKYREDTMRWMTIAAGILFFLSGLISVIVYYYEKREIARSPYTFDQTGNEIRRHSPIFPFIGVGSMLLGIILMVMPTDLLIGVTYVLGAMLILGAASQLFNLFMSRRFWSIPIIYWLFSTILLGIGILVVAKPMETATLPLKIIGWALMVFGVVECVNAFSIFRARKKFLLEQEKTSAMEQENNTTIEDAVIVD
ncbi:MAG: DUF308 domain-containing protein [Prevotella sp.]|nr:DUF308 domain-containing protein [Prevotella sp.]